MPKLNSIIRVSQSWVTKLMTLTNFHQISPLQTKSYFLIQHFYVQLISYSWYLVNGDYISIPKCTGCCGYLFHEIQSITKIWSKDLDDILLNQIESNRIKMKTIYNNKWCHLLHLILISWQRQLVFFKYFYLFYIYDLRHIKRSRTWLENPTQLICVHIKLQ